MLAGGAQAVCAFVNDRLDAPPLQALVARGVELILLRSAGFNHVDLAAAAAVSLLVTRVRSCSQHAVAEHAMALILTLNRKTHRAWMRVREGNFALYGLLGFDLGGKTVGVVGTGQIGTILLRILHGFGCRLIAHDPFPNAECLALGGDYVALDVLFEAADILTLQCPLTPETFHMVYDTSIARMKPR